MAVCPVRRSTEEIVGTMGTVVIYTIALIENVPECYTLIFVCIFTYLHVVCIEV